MGFRNNTVLGHFRFHRAINGTVVSAATRVVYNNDDEHLCATEISSDSWTRCGRKQRGCGRLPGPLRAPGHATGSQGRAREGGGRLGLPCSRVTRSPEPFTACPPVAELGRFSEGIWGWAGRGTLECTVAGEAGGPGARALNYREGLGSCLQHPGPAPQALTEMLCLLCATAPDNK